MHCDQRVDVMASTDGLGEHACCEPRTLKWMRDSKAPHYFRYADADGRISLYLPERAIGTNPPDAVEFNIFGFGPDESIRDFQPQLDEFDYIAALHEGDLHDDQYRFDVVWALGGHRSKTSLYLPTREKAECLDSCDRLVIACRIL